MSVMRIKDAQGNWQEVAALHGLPGTSVSITSISQSTEDDGYSVVTFSDGKQLRVKNGSKGSQGEQGPAGSGGSGGSTSKYAQPDWGVEANGEILPETELVHDEESGMAPLLSPLSTPLVSGEVYTVVFNGTEYQCTAVEITGEGHLLGNGEMFGLESTNPDAPFMLMVALESVAQIAGFYGYAAALDGSASFTIAIKGGVVHKIPESYIEGGGIFCVGVTKELVGNDWIVRYDKPFADVLSALMSGKQVYAVDGGDYVPVSCFNSNSIQFKGTYMSVNRTNYSTTVNTIMYGCNADEGENWYLQDTVIKN